MSIKLQDLIWDLYPGPRSEMLLALKLADFANDDGTGIYPSVGTLARKTRADERTVQRQLAAMIARGWLIFTGRRNARYGTNEYRIDPAWCEQGRRNATPQPPGKAVDKSGKTAARGDIAARGRGDISPAAGVTPVSPNPSGEPIRIRQQKSSGPEHVGDLLEIPSFLRRGTD